MCNHHGSPNFQGHGRTAFLGPPVLTNEVEEEVSCVLSKWKYLNATLRPQVLLPTKLMLLSSHNSRTELLPQRPYDVHSQKYLLPGSLQKTFPNPVETTRTGELLP